ncbi:restriction endonuclease subunit S [Arthrobacter sp. StoSoilB20]|uniref:restriction endonuclease subunit S n=1 Tax=Arthrobacter sp. StoSoilB20 TaxID=2830995 RepID=UPI001CC6CDD7|nr:restriction endonuclease subunit S [Arthrobacter sp. StoSoilB20]
MPKVSIKEVAVERGLVGGPFGSSLGQKDYSVSGVPVIRGTNLGYGRALGGEYVYVSEEKVRNVLARNTAEPGDLVFTQRGTLGQVALVTNDHFPVYVVSQSQMRLRVDPSIASAEYLYYACSSSQFFKQIHDNAISTGVPHINLGILSRLTVPLPELSGQQAIAEVLGALDNKIAANTILARMAMELSEKLYSQIIKSSEIIMKPLGKMATTVLGGTPSRNNLDFWTEGTVPWLNSGKANEDRIIQPSEYITTAALERSAAKLMPIGATVIAITGATLGQVSRLEIEASGNQSLVGVWTQDRAVNDWLHFAIHDRIPELLKKATGAAQQHVNKRDVDALEIPCPAPERLASFAAKASPLLETAAYADHENLKLAATRDAMLPQLLSGRLRVKDVEKLLEGAGI